MVAGELPLPGVTRDPKDDAIVACAREGGAASLVSGDRDLLDRHEVEGTRVVLPREFVEMLASEAGHGEDLAG